MDSAVGAQGLRSRGGRRRRLRPATPDGPSRPRCRRCRSSLLYDRVTASNERPLSATRCACCRSGADYLRAHHRHHLPLPLLLRRRGDRQHHQRGSAHDPGHVGIINRVHPRPATWSTRGGSGTTSAKALLQPRQRLLAGRRAGVLPAATTFLGGWTTPERRRRGGCGASSAGSARQPAPAPRRTRTTVSTGPVHFIGRGLRPASTTLTRRNLRTESYTNTDVVAAEGGAASASRRSCFPPLRLQGELDLPP
jgi:hypothetical protein